MKRHLIAVLLTLFVAACGVGASSDAVGGECTTDQDCDHICSKEDTFGTGMCTQHCTTDNDCPTDAVCTEKGGGLCAVSCAVADDCSGFGRGFTCKELKRASGGDTLVCRTP